MLISVNGIELYYEVVGAGQPLIMIHGNGEDHTIFDKAVERLQKYYTCILPDSRGHGQSSPVDTLSYQDMADDVLALCNALDLQNPVFYGFSDGGIIGLLAAIKRPDYFAKMIISGANTNPRGVKNWLHAQFKLEYIFTKDPKIRLMLREPHITKKQLASIKTPTLVLAGSKDLIRESHTRAIAAAIPDATLRILPGEEHGSYIVHSEKIARLIHQFCRR